MKKELMDELYGKKELLNIPDDMFKVMISLVSALDDYKEVLQGTASIDKEKKFVEIMENAMVIYDVMSKQTEISKTR